MTIGERIAFFRKNNKISQQDFANAVSISRTHISKIENNQDKPSSKLLRTIAEEYNINYEWLTEGTGEMCLNEEEVLLKSPEFLKYKMKETLKNMNSLLEDNNSRDLQLHLYSLDLLLNTFIHIKRKASNHIYTQYAENIEKLLELLWLLSVSQNDDTMSKRKKEIIDTLDECITILKSIL